MEAEKSVRVPLPSPYSYDLRRKAILFKTLRERCSEQW
jgi:hypothetical protein